MQLIFWTWALLASFLPTIVLATPQIPTPTPAPMAAPSAIPAPPEISAKAYLLEDFHSGQIIAGANVDTPLEPASLTKIMTSYVVEKALQSGELKPDELVTISETAWRESGSKMFIEVGKQVPVVDLLRGVIIQSGNDASVALAERLAGSEEAFASLMNHHAKRLGMNQTHFMNSTGLPHKDHYTTAKDLAILTRALIRELPQHYQMYSEKWFTFNNIKQHNRNGLLWSDNSVDGVKTGFTDTAGFCLVASGQRDNMRLISVILGSTSPKIREKETQKLLSYGFRFYETPKLLSASQNLQSMRLWLGQQDSLSLGAPADVFITVPRGQAKLLSSRIELATTQIRAPVNKGQPFGKIVVTMNDKTVVEQPLVALETVPQGNFIKRWMDRITMIFNKLFGGWW